MTFDAVPPILMSVGELRTTFEDGIRERLGLTGSRATLTSIAYFGTLVRAIRIATMINRDSESYNACNYTTSAALRTTVGAQWARVTPAG